MVPNVLLWPVLIYLAAALIIPRLRFVLSEDGRTLGMLFSSVLAFGMALWLTVSANNELPWMLSNWDGTLGLGHAIQFRLDTFGASFLLLTTLIGVAVLVGCLDEVADVLVHDYQAGLLLLLAGVAAFALADNLLTMVVVALLLDAGLLSAIGLAGRPRWILVLITHSLIAQGLMIVATLLLWQESGSTLLVTTNEQVVFLLIASTIVRMGLLPFSLIPIAFEPLPQRILALLPLSTLGIGSVLLGRLMLGGPMPDLSLVALFAAFGIGLAGWLAWWREESSVRLMMLSAAQAGWLLWGFAWGLSMLAIASAWSAVLALSALAIHGGRVNLRHPVQVHGVIAALILVGVPGTALWQTATALSGEAWLREVGNSNSGPIVELFMQSVGNATNWILVLGAIGMMGTLAALIEWLVVDVEEDQAELAQPSRLVGASLLAILSIPIVGRLFGLEVPLLPQVMLAKSPLAAQLSLLIIGWAGGLWLWRMRPELRSFYPLFDNISTIFSLVWLWRLIGRVGWLLLSGYRGMILVLEGENYGWLLLFLFVMLIFLVQ
ncbi:MAG: hypothetical protein ACPGWR_27425 [Ardenticatenaceae bacterium]